MTPPAGTVWSCSGAQSPWHFLPEDRLQAAPQRGPSAAEYYRSIKRDIVQGERNSGYSVGRVQLFGLVSPPVAPLAAQVSELKLPHLPIAQRSPPS